LHAGVCGLGAEPVALARVAPAIAVVLAGPLRVLASLEVVEEEELRGGALGLGRGGARDTGDDRERRDGEELLGLAHGARVRRLARAGASGFVPTRRDAA